MGCAFKNDKRGPEKGKIVYSYVDETGTHRLERETKNIDSKIITRNRLIDIQDGNSKLIEKSITVSRVGSIKDNNIRQLTVRPEVSEYEVWIEGKKYYSRIEINPAKRAMILSYDGPEPRWQGKSEIAFPKSKFFCFYNQIPECLYHNYFLKSILNYKRKSKEFYVVWDSFPFIKELYSQIGTKLFSAASVKYDGSHNGLIRFAVEVEGQIILYQFDSSFNLVKVAWISQGVTIAPPGEEIAEEE